MPEISANGGLPRAAGKNDVASGPRGRPTFSIIVPAYNVAAYIDDAISSLLAQSDPDWQLVVVDDGSTDGLDSVIEAYDDPRIDFVSQPHLGLSAARRNGLSRARGEFIVILDGDDRLRPTALAAFRAVLAVTPDVGLVFGRRALCGEDGRVIGEPFRWRRWRRMNGDALRLTLAACPITSLGQAAFRRSVLERAGGYPLGDLGAGDWYFCVLLAAVAPFAEIDDIVLDYRLRPDSVVRTWGRRAETSGSLDIDEFSPMIRRMYETPAIRQSLTADELRRLERRSQAHAYCVKGYECLRARSWASARRYLQRGLRAYPFNPTALVCLFLARARWLPTFLRAAIGHERRI